MPEKIYIIMRTDTEYTNDDELEALIGDFNDYSYVDKVFTNKKLAEEYLCQAQDALEHKELTVDWNSEADSVYMIVKEIQDSVPDPRWTNDPNIPEFCEEYEVRNGEIQKVEK